LRATRTPIELDDRTRKPTKTLRATRTPIDLTTSTRKPTKTLRATRTPIDLTTSTRKPTKTLRPTRTPIPAEVGAEFNAGGILASCRPVNKGGPGTKDVDLIRVALAVTNNSGSAIRGVVPGAITITGGSVRMDSTPAARSSLPNFATAMFEWSFNLNGTVDITVNASATGPNGEEINIGPISCGSISGGAN